MPLVDHPSGGYRFLPGIAPYSCGVVSAPGYEIVNVTLHRPDAALFPRIERQLAAEGLPKTALCAVALRSPRPYTFAGFGAFNATYAKVLESWGVFVDGVNPVARTNVAPEVHPPTEPVLYGFSYARPCNNDSGPTFVVAGAGELPEGVLSAEGIIARGDVSEAGIATKARFVMDLMETRLRGLGGDWPGVTAADIYTIHSLDRVLPEIVLSRMKGASIHGVRWFYTRPPIAEIEYEMDLRGVRTELRID